MGLNLPTWVKQNITLITQNPVSIFKYILKLGFYTKPRFNFFVIPAIEPHWIEIKQKNLIIKQGRVYSR